MKNIKTLIITILLIFCITPVFAATANTDEVTSGVDRYAVFIGSNKGGKGREQLLYAGSDAKNFQKAMSEIGGLSDSNSYILIDPSKEKIDETLTKISQKITANAGNAKRSEFLFYYSGHSDETSLLLGDTPYDYSTLKTAITDVPSDIHVVILDSCYSGNFIRTKGGQKRKPFLMDDSSVVTGHAYLSSSSSNEYSQESDEIESSYFTNAMITGLRGAADTSGDNKVTLNELYSYAFNDTLSKTESSKAGPQHPNYNITLVGSGDLVLSDISTGESMLSLSKEAKGKFIIRNSEGRLISEINKTEGQPIFMALSAGQYSAVIIDEYATKQGTFVLEKDRVYVLDQDSLKPIKRKNNRIRGTVEDEDLEVESEVLSDDDEFLSVDDLYKTNRSRRRYQSEGNGKDNLIYDTSIRPAVSEDDSEETAKDLDDDGHFKFPEFSIAESDIFHLALVPGFTFLKLDGSKDTTFTAVGIFGSLENNVMGFQLSNLMNISTGYVYGLQQAGLFNISKNLMGAQISGLFNITHGDVKGAQIAGLFNTSSGRMSGIQIGGLANIGGEIGGFQVAGLINVAKKIDGVQIGLINVAEDNNGIALGLFNFIKNGVHDVGVSWNTNDMLDAFIQSGTNNLFFTVGASAFRQAVFNPYSASLIENQTGVFYAGIGTRILMPSSSLDFEFLWKTYIGYYNTYLRENDFDARNVIIENIPAFRFTLNLTPGKHFTLFGGLGVDLNFHGYNDQAFKYLPSKLNLDFGDSLTLKPNLFIGIKIR